MTWILASIAVWAVSMVLALALCKAAAYGDRRDGWRP